MEKAKKLADQAQQKIDETQKGFNENQAQKAGGGGAPARYDDHGRPIPTDTPPAGAATPPAADPAVQAPPAPPAPGSAPPAPAPPAPAADQPPAPEEEAPAPVQGENNPTPDPFKPIQ